jgi:putative membrane protein
MKIQATLFAAALALVPAFARAQSSSTSTGNTSSTGTSSTDTSKTGSSDTSKTGSTTPSGMPTNDTKSSATRGYQPDSAQPASQADRTDRDSDNAMPKKLSEKELLPKLHHVNQEEIKAGQLAQQKGSSSDVKSYGKMLVTDHQKADQDLQKLASKANIDLTAMKMDTKSQEKREVKEHKMDQLQTMTGKDFDRGFTQMMVNGHQHVIDLVKASRDDARPEVKSFLDKQLPVLQKHLDKAKDVMNKAGNTASAR